MLVAEASLDLRGLLATRFERDGFEVEEVRDGLEALERIEALGPRGEPHYPDLLVVGLRMPGLGGVLVLEALRAATPLIVLAVNADGATRHRVLDLGCAVLLDGPVEAGEVRS